jgi:hypothetical protein
MEGERNMTTMTSAPAVQAIGSAAFGRLETQEPLTNAQIESIARGLLAQLTLEEKIGMMSGESRSTEIALFEPA